MAIQEYRPNNMIDLSSSDGNVFNLIGMAVRLSKQLDKDSKVITKEMIASDYRNAVYVFNREFGDFIDLKLPEGMTANSVRNSYMKTNLNEEKLREGYLR